MYIDLQWMYDHLGWIIAFEALAVFAYYAWDYYRFKQRYGSGYSIDLAAKKSDKNGESAPGAGAYRTIKPRNK